MLNNGSANVSSKEKLHVKLVPFSMLNKIFWFSMLNIGSANLSSKEKMQAELFPISMLNTGSATVSSEEKL